MLMDYVPGGELFSYLRNRGRFSNGTGLFYSAEIVCAIEYLHSKEIVYRDLKPENILLDREGHIRLTDFGFAKKLSDRYASTHLFTRRGQLPSDNIRALFYVQKKSSRICPPAV